MSSEFAKRQKKDFFRDISSLGSLLWYLIILLVCFLARQYDLFTKLAAGLAIIYIVVIFIRTVYFKQRPEKYGYNSYLEKLDASSFPSLHSTRSVFMAMALMNFFGRMQLSVVFGALAVLISYSRVHLRKHDLIDVLAGAVLGILVYFAVGYLV